MIIAQLLIALNLRQHKTKTLKHDNTYTTKREKTESIHETVRVNIVKNCRTRAKMTRGLKYQIALL